MFIQNFISFTPPKNLRCKQIDSIINQYHCFRYYTPTARTKGIHCTNYISTNDCRVDIQKQVIWYKEIMPWSWKMKTFKEKIEIHPSKHVSIHKIQRQSHVPTMSTLQEERELKQLFVQIKCLHTETNKDKDTQLIRGSLGNEAKVTSAFPLRRPWTIFIGKMTVLCL